MESRVSLYQTHNEYLPKNAKFLHIYMSAQPGLDSASKMNEIAYSSYVDIFKLKFTDTNNLYCKMFHWKQKEDHEEEH